jgi:hypothetical protein
MIKIVKDIDLYDHFSEYDIILIGTNIYCTMSQGIQLKVMLNYPYVYEKNLKTKYGDMEKMGTILECKSESEEPTFCLCFITKGYNFRPDLEKDYLSYDALENALKLVNIKYKGKKIACPLLGSSRFDGNGDKEKIFSIFKKTLKDVECTVFDYFQKSRAEEIKERMKIEFAVKKKDRKAYYEMVRKRKEEANERFKKNGHRRY